MCFCVDFLGAVGEVHHPTPYRGMNNNRNGPTTDHGGVVFDYNGLVLDKVAHFGTSYDIRALALTLLQP